MNSATTLIILGVIVLISIVLAILAYVFRKEAFSLLPMLNSSSVSNFKFDGPKAEFSKVVKEFGEPSYVANVPGGVALWKGPDFFTEIFMIDESILHTLPKFHCDYLYATINVYIPDDILCTVLKLSQSIYYDQLKKELTARCHFMGANVATLYLALMIVNDQSNASKYLTAYGPTIMSTMNEDTYIQLKGELKKLVLENQQKYAKMMPDRNCSIA